MNASRSITLRHAETGTVPRPATGPRGLAWVWAGTVERTHPVKGSETLHYATLRDYSRYPGPVLRELAQRLPRRRRPCLTSRSP